MKLGRAASLIVCAWLAWLAWLAWPGGLQLTAAQDRSAPAEVRLSFEECESASYSVGELGALVRVELQSLGVATVHAAADGGNASEPGMLAFIQLRCGAKPATLVLEVSDLVSGNRISRELVITDVEPAARPRALSLTIASLLESSWGLLAARPSRLGEGQELPASVREALRRRLGEQLVPPPPAAANVGAKLEPDLIHLALSARAFPSRGSGVLGIDFAFLPSLGSDVYLGLDLEVIYGLQEVRDATGPLADLELLWLSAGAGLFITSETAPQLIIGPIVRVAYTAVWASTEAPTLVARDADGWLFALGASASLRFALGAGWDGILGAELGYVPGGVAFLAEERSVISLADVTTALRIGFGRAL